MHMTLPASGYMNIFHIYVCCSKLYNNGFIQCKQESLDICIMLLSLDILKKQFKYEIKLSASIIAKM